MEEKTAILKLLMQKTKKDIYELAYEHRSYYDEKGIADIANATFDGLANLLDYLISISMTISGLT